MRFKSLAFLREGYDRFLEAQQVRMSSNFDGLELLAILGLVCGVLSGGVIILFRLFMDGAAAQLLPSGSIEGFEDLSRSSRFWLCVGGGLLVGLFLHLLKPKARNVGVVHVLERLEYHQGNLQCETQSCSLSAPASLSLVVIQWAKRVQVCIWALLAAAP